jgi:Fe2+ or Zn2+ uptake regulation protein
MSKHNDCSHTLSKEKVLELLTLNGLNRTKAKIDFLIVLSRASSPLSISEIHQAMGKEVNISTVFRTVNQLKEKNLISETNLGEGFLRYELSILHENEHHHHHIRCKSCGEIKRLEFCDLSLIEKSLKKFGYIQIEHSLEFLGLCPNCC